MKQIIGAFGTLMVFVMNTFLCISMSNVSAAVAEAKEFKAAVVAEIEDSNFNRNVIEGCIKEAQKAGYEMQVTNCVYDEEQNLRMAEVLITYTYEIPLFGIAEKKVTRGIAR